MIGGRRNFRVSGKKQGQDEPVFQNSTQVLFEAQKVPGTFQR